MTVTLTSEAVGQLPGTTYTGPEEDWLLANGYASKAGHATKGAAVLTGGTNAVNVVTGGNIVLHVGSKVFTVAIATSDTPSQAATKIDTALAGYADAAITSSKLVVTSVALGSAVTVGVLSGTGTVVANLGVTVGQVAAGHDGGVGVSATGASDVVPGKDLQEAVNREPEPTKFLDGTQDPGPRDPAMGFTDADEPVYDFDIDGLNLEAPSAYTLKPTALVLAGGKVEATGQNFKRTSGVTVGGTAATNVVVKSDSVLTFIAPAKTAGTYDVIVTNPNGATTKTGGLTYA